MAFDSLLRMVSRAVVTLALVVSALPAFAVDMDQVKRDLAGEGLNGFVHGSVGERGLFVFTYRNPKDYFDMSQMSLVPGSNEIRERLAALTRHDKIRIHGALLHNSSPQPHIRVRDFEITEKYESSVPPYEHTSIPEELKHASSAVFLVHAIAGGGRILVLEYGDQIVPVFVKKPELTQGLFRNDLVELKIRAQAVPSRPMHLGLDDTKPEPVKVLEKMEERHFKPAVVEGALIMFPRSPDIQFNVFAVQEPLRDNLSRQYTLINFDDPAAFLRIREKLQAEWDKYPGQYVSGRNKLVSTKIRIRVTGKYNVVSDSQANVQVLLDDEKSIEILD